MNATQYTRKGVSSVTSQSGSQKVKNTSLDSSASAESWMCCSDERWINHYNAEWQAFIEKHSSKRAGAAGNFSGRDALPCVWNMPAE
jgi:hypothetical protein